MYLRCDGWSMLILPSLSRFVGAVIWACRGLTHAGRVSVCLFHPLMHGHSVRVCPAGTLRGKTQNTWNTWRVDCVLSGDTGAPSQRRNYPYRTSTYQNEKHLNILSISYRVKHTYSAHTYNELTLIVKWFSFPLGFKHIVKLTDITNYIYNEAKLSVPGTLL